MSRKSPSDTFTRFTSTSPHAAQNPTSFSSSRSSRSTAFNIASPDGETPAGKVARLRAASRAAKERINLSPVDRVIHHGRIWADRAHRVTTYGLIGITGIAAVVSVYSLTSLITHNRRQKRAWIERELDRLQDAQKAFLRGDASAEQLHLLEQERAGMEMSSAAAAEKQRRKEQSYWNRLKGFVSGGGEMGTESQLEAKQRIRRQAGPEALLTEGWVEEDEAQLKKQPRRMAPVAVAESGIRGVGVDEKGRPVPAGKMRVTEAVIDREKLMVDQADNAAVGTRGGPLDVMASNVVTKVSGDSKGWLSWIRGDRS